MDYRVNTCHPCIHESIMWRICIAYVEGSIGKIISKAGLVFILFVVGAAMFVITSSEAFFLSFTFLAFRKIQDISFLSLRCFPWALIPSFSSLSHFPWCERVLSCLRFEDGSLSTTLPGEDFLSIASRSC